MYLIQQFKKQGGWKLIKLWIKTGVLFPSLFQLLLTGFSKTSLEIVRLVVSLKINKKLTKQFLPFLCEFDSQHKQHSIDKVSYRPRVWMCWMQGLDSAPDIVKRCIRSIEDNIKDRDIILLTSENIHNYILFPKYIEEKYAHGIISHAHYSDLLRTALLAKYGGTWIDSTVFCSGGIIPKYMMDSDFFVFQDLKPGKDGHITSISNWFMTAKPGNIIIEAQLFLLYKYWENYNYAIDYFFFHQLMTLVEKFYNDEWNHIVQFPNSFPHILLLMLFDDFSQIKWDAVIQSCPFHKLTYKCSNEDMNRSGTFYQFLMNH